MECDYLTVATREISEGNNFVIFQRQLYLLLKRKYKNIELFIKILNG